MTNHIIRVYLIYSRSKKYFKFNLNIDDTEEVQDR